MMVYGFCVALNSSNMQISQPDKCCAKIFVIPNDPPSFTCCPIARHHTVSVRHCTLLKIFRTANVRCCLARHHTFVPCDQLFSSISFTIWCRTIGQRILVKCRLKNETLPPKKTIFLCYDNTKIFTLHDSHGMQREQIYPTNLIIN